MLQIKHYKAAFVTPSDDEIKEGIEIARQNDCIVRIDYFVPYSGLFHLDIYPDSTPESCHASINYK